MTRSQLVFFGIATISAVILTVSPSTRTNADTSVDPLSNLSAAVAFFEHNGFECKYQRGVVGGSESCTKQFPFFSMTADVMSVSADGAISRINLYTQNVTDKAAIRQYFDSFLQEKIKLPVDLDWQSNGTGNPAFAYLERFNLNKRVTKNGNEWIIQGEIGPVQKNDEGIAKLSIISPVY